MKLQKIMIDAGFTCPNRDGRVGTGGCTFCRTDSYAPAYCQGSIAHQIEEGKKFFAGKYPEMKFLAYFQSYSNTYAPLPVLKQRYEEALSCPDVVGLVIGTRPDCLPSSVIEYLVSLKERGFSIQLEIGVETFIDRTLQRINRCHTAAQSIDAINRCAAAGLHVGIHLIIGLPGETKSEILSIPSIINSLPVSSIKFHQLQILKGTRMAEEWLTLRDEFEIPTLEEYIQLMAELTSLLRQDITIERYASGAPSSLLIFPRWGIKPSQIAERIKNYH